MKKFKETTDQFRERILGVRKEQVKDEVKTEIQKQTSSELPYQVIDVIQDPDTKSRSYLYVRIKYDPVTRKAIVESIVPCLDKTTGYAMILDKENRKYLFEKAGGSKT